jgi:hypothetical protein
MKKILSIFTTLLIFSGCSSIPHAATKNCTNKMCTLETHTDKMAVTYQVKGENLVVNMSAKTTGWVAIGFGSSYYMKDATIVMGYVNKEGDPLLSNEYGTGYTSHTSTEKLGAKPEAKLISGDFVDGWTIIKFSIPLIAKNNKYGKIFKSGETMKVIMAYGPNGAKNFKNIHKYKTINSINLADLPKNKN